MDENELNIEKRIVPQWKVVDAFNGNEYDIYVTYQDGQRIAAKRQNEYCRETRQNQGAPKLDVVPVRCKWQWNERRNAFVWAAPEE